jgi:hypothetical protein
VAGVAKRGQLGCSQQVRAREGGWDGWEGVEGRLEMLVFVFVVPQT